MNNVLYNISNVDEIKNSSQIIIFISKREVKYKDYNRIENIINLFNQAGKLGKEKLTILFDGYNDDEREIYMIDEIRRYVKAIFEKCKHIFYYLSNLDNNRSIIFACLNNIRCLKVPDKKEVVLEIIYKDDIKQQVISAMLSWGMILDDIEECQRIIFTFI